MPPSTSASAKSSTVKAESVKMGRVSKQRNPATLKRTERRATSANGPSELSATTPGRKQLTEERLARREPPFERNFAPNGHQGGEPSSSFATSSTALTIPETVVDKASKTGLVEPGSVCPPPSIDSARSPSPTEPALNASPMDSSCCALPTEPASPGDRIISDSSHDEESDPESRGPIYLGQMGELFVPEGQNIDNPIKRLFPRRPRNATVVTASEIDAQEPCRADRDRYDRVKRGRGT